MPRTIAIAALAVALAATTTVRADDGGAPSRDAGAAISAKDAGAAVTAKDARPPSSASPHGDGDEEMTGQQNPHGHGEGMQGPPQDGSMEDPSTPPGTIAVTIANESGQPQASTEVTLGILYNSVAKGESRKRVTQTTDAQGGSVFKGLDTGTGVAYRVSVVRDGATFAIMPFQLPAKNGVRALLHVYPVVSDVKDAMIATQAILFAEVKDDRIQLQQAFRIYNLGHTAWVPVDLVLPLPPNFTAFATQQGMSDVGADAVPGRGVRIRGTFAPGQHVVEFRWQLPYAGESDVRFDVGMSPNMAAARVIAPAAKDMQLEVAGFPPPQPTNDGQGQRVLIAERQFHRDEGALANVSVTIKGLPTAGPARWIASLVALGCIVLGIVLGTGRPQKLDLRGERARRLVELEELERAHARGDVGPKTYERARRELLDELARLFALEPKGKPGRPSRKKVAA